MKHRYRLDTILVATLSALVRAGSRCDDAIAALRQAGLPGESLQSPFGGLCGTQ
jgi:hypothetical protein